MGDLLDLQGGGEECHVSKHTMRKWVHQRKLPYVRLGRQICFRREDIEKFIKNSLVQPLSDRQSHKSEQE